MNDALSRLQVQGDPNAVDSFAACLTAILQAWGKPVGYAYVEALTGLAFSPSYNKSEECVGWMMDGGSEQRIDFLGRAMGFSVERLELSKPLDEAGIAAYKENGTLPAHIEAHFGRWREAIAQGKMVLAYSWPAWSVITGWSDDVTELPFVTTPRFDTVVRAIYPPYRAWLSFILTDGAARAELAQVYREAIRYGATVASGKVACGKTAYGGAMYEQVAALSSEQHLCPGCAENGCLSRTFKRMYDGQLASIAFLKEAGAYLQGPVQDRWRQEAIDRYTELQDLTARYLDWASLADQHDQPAFRQQIAADFSRAKSLHGEAATALSSLAASIA